MKKGFALQSLICLLFLSCSVHELDTMDSPVLDNDMFYASLESYSMPETKVYVDENIKILWDEDDRITIFNENTLNQQYRFLGESGDNSGYFDMVTTGNSEPEGNLDFICAVYPYLASTSVSNSSVTLTLPAEQTYRKDSFGPGANTMVSVTENKLLKFKNVGGYLVLRFYGTETSVSSITLEGRNGEPLSGEATFTPVLGAIPTITMASSAGTSITLTSKDPVKLGKTKAKSTVFWMVVPPTTFTQGITLTVTGEDGKVFIKETDQDLTIDRNGVLKIAPIEVILADPLEPNKVIYYTSSDKSVITPVDNADFGANIVSNDYVDLTGIMAFDGNVTQIGAHAFEGCETLTSITIPSTVTSIGESAFARCTNLGAPNTPSGSDITEPSKSPNRSGETTLVIPEGVTSIGAHAFEECSSLTSIIIPEGVTTIGACAFMNCTSLTSITIPSTVTSIGDFAFADCTNLSSIDLPANVEMGLNVFMGRTGITSVIIPEGTTSIGDYAYAWCENLTAVNIPESVTSIGKHAFEMCSSLTEVRIPDSVKSIGEDAFNDCENIVSINIPAGITKIENGTFAACMSLTSIDIPNSVKWIGSSAFESCFALANVSLPSSIEYIDSYAFAQCFSFTTFTIPSKVTRISAGLFNDCRQLTSIIIHDSVESIGYGAFYQCTSLPSITIPSSVTCIENQVFNGCTGLISITIEAVNPPVTEDRMDYTFVDTNDCPIYVPAGSVNAYREAEGWSQYASRIYAIGPQTGTINDHAYVDLGTGAKWATMNVGAESETEYGNLYAWGKTEPRVFDPDYVYDYTVAFVDVATVDWGQTWRYPTAQEWSTLMDLSRFTWTWDSIHRGYWVESKIQGYVGNKIFLPAAGSLGEPENPNWEEGNEGCYWAYFTISDPSNQFWFWDVSGMVPEDPEDPVCFFTLSQIGFTGGAGLSVRPVSD